MQKPVEAFHTHIFLGFLSFLFNLSIISLSFFLAVCTAFMKTLYTRYAIMYNLCCLVWARPELLRYLSCLFVMMAGVRVYLSCQISKGKTKVNSGNFGCFEQSYHHLVVPAERNHIWCDSFEMLCRCSMCSRNHMRI